MAKFTSNIWFKCIAVLLIISIASGGLIAILNDVLYVSSEERTERAISKIYGEKISADKIDVILDCDSNDETLNSIVEYDFGRIEKIYSINGDVLYKAVGYKGYKNGTVTLWVKTDADGNIDKVILEGYNKQTLMSKFGAEYFAEFSDDYSEEYGNPMSGASYSATACSNAVNCVIKYADGGNK